MATLFLFKNQQIFYCTYFSRTLRFAGINRNNLISLSTFHTKKPLGTSKINRIPSSFLIVRKKPPLSFRHISQYLNLSVLKKTNKLQQTQLRRGFHTTPTRKVAPLLWMIIKPVIKLITLLGGRRFRFWYQTLPFEQKKLVINWQNTLKILTVLTFFGITYYISHLQETPITKRIRFIAFTDEQFMKIANFEAKLQEKMKENSFLSATHPSYDRVIRIMEKLVHNNWALSNMKTHKWKVAIVDSCDINAFVLATGHVYVNVGLLNFVQNDNQLAIVLAHEMAHTLLGHAAEKVSFSQIIDYLVIILMAAIWAFMPFDGIALVTQAFYEKVVEILLDNPYSRKLEKEADIVGLELAAKACFDVREGYNFWKLMEYSEKLKSTEIPEWLSTHPSHVKRQELIEHFIPKAISIREKYHCGPLNENDPRDCLKDMEKMVQNVLNARRAGQNLSKLNKYLTL